ncbi:uncharacterized protein BO72DRAFT_378266 [Aspergillus fijiensis CBS 313.89]|uniref:Molybdopterin synthase sulfur carrier subunit n=1 Tax=Aspergillus fijiensis CBS 313.89 TaxID=1448319 RepID=A0A8G1RPS7_9EURO|nr:uncharacterized protein BO72DRAFT_378266 [Aspergillus fijiensis CBS 313.89]RAK77079.1 hypothetical protein BO72DRAFT_378266 [Aspergillus fijiensis CBS 313.89]
MSTEDPFAFLGEEQKQTHGKKPHWREKLFSKDKKARGSTDQQIEAFLGPTRSKSLSYGATTTQRELRPLRPDAASRWPSAQDVLNASSSITAAHDVTPVADFTKPPYKSRPRKGVKVRFADRKPEVIGEGGDEVEVPTMEISLCRNRAQSLESTESDSQSEPEEPPQLRLDTSFGGNDAPTPREKSREHPKALALGTRAEDWKPLLLHNAQDADFLMTLSLGERGSRLSFRASPESNSFAQRVRAKMQAEEGLALQHRLSDPMSPGDENETQSPALRVPDSPSSTYETPPISETEPTPPENPFKDSPSPPSVTRSVASERPVLSPVLSTSSNIQTPSSPIRQPNPNLPVPEVASRPSSRDAREPSRSPQPPKFSLKSIANQLGDTAFADLKGYVVQFRDPIEIAAESAKPLVGTPLSEWMRAALWWFLRGKKRLEAYARSRPSSSSSGVRSPQTRPAESAKQAVVDLAKALWITENIVPQHEELARYGSMSVDALLAVASTTGNKELADLLSLSQTISNHLRSLAMSIKRNNILMTLAQERSPSDIDSTVWVQYPAFAPDVAAILSGTATKSLLVDTSGKAHSFVQMMPLGDTNRYFSYGSMFVDVCITSSDDDDKQHPVPCALSIIRDRADWYVFAAITSQSDLVNIVIQSDKKNGPTWESVNWHVRSHSMRVKLPRGFELHVQFQEEDFKNIWNIVQYTSKTEASLKPEKNETLIYENTLKTFRYIDSVTPKAFPSEPVERCRIRLFERTVPLTEGTGQRMQHQGFRIAILTSPKIKTLSSVRHILGSGAPLVFGLLRGDDGAPALLLKVKEDGRTRSMLMAFEELEERTMLHSLLLGILPQEREAKSSDISIRAFTLEQPADRAAGKPAKEHIQFPAGTISIIDEQYTRPDHGYGPTVLSEHLRAFIATEWGSVTDRLNLGPGELKLGLDVNNRTGLSLYRPGQKDLTVSVAENMVIPEMPDKLTDSLSKIMANPTIRRFDFATVQDLHTFQQAVTGFRVLFDSVASSFAISRRRMVVPITKKWESSLARVQVIRRDRVVQLVAFLSDFQYGRCMNFVLKGTDTLEPFGKSGKFGVRIVDAKFALPKSDDDPASNFVSLDTPDYPMEHDDISIAFDSEAEMGTSTRSLHADDALNVVSDVAPPIHVATTFRYSDNPDDLVPFADLTGDRDKTAHIYSRLSAPSSTRFEAILSSLLNGEAISYSSGLSALHAALTLLNPRRIAIGNGYHGCHGVIALFSRVTGLQKLELDCPAEQLEAGDVIHLETPVNPEGTAFNIEAYAKKAHSRGAYLIVDATFAPPFLQDPFKWGADLVLHSGSKYFGGHSDVLCGVLATQREDWAKQLLQDRIFLGSVMGNMESWLGVRSLRTLEVRVQRQSENATKLVSWLHQALSDQNPASGSDEALVQAALDSVLHASLQKEDESWLFKQMPNGFGPVFSIITKTEDYARKLPSKLAFFQHATSLGGVETLIEWRTMSDTTVDRRLLRISVGLENWEDLRQDLQTRRKPINPLATMSTFQIHYFSTATSYTGKQTERLPAPLPLDQLFPLLEARYPGITAAVLRSCGVSVREEYVDVEGEDARTVVIGAGDEVAVIPPVSSG